MSLNDWKGLESLEAEALLTELRPQAERAIERAAMLFVKEVVQTLSGPRHGRVYVRRGIRHIASAPGEPPAVDTGRLRQSMTWTGPHWEGWTVSAEVGTNVEYAARMEYGGVDSRGIRILARPYMEPTAIRVEPMIDAIFAEVVGS